MRMRSAEDFGCGRDSWMVVKMGQGKSQKPQVQNRHLGHSTVANASGRPQKADPTKAGSAVGQAKRVRCIVPLQHKFGR